MSIFPSKMFLRDRIRVNFLAIILNEAAGKTKKGQVVKKKEDLPLFLIGNDC